MREFNLKSETACVKCSVGGQFYTYIYNKYLKNLFQASIFKMEKKNNLTRFNAFFFSALGVATHKKYKWQEFLLTEKKD